jgi:hypothetical protein
MKVRVLSFGGGRFSRAKMIALAIVALVLGGIFFALGLALLATLLVAGAIVGAGVMIARLFRGHRPLPPRRGDLDPSLEVFPPEHETRRIDDPSSLQ